MALLGNDLIVYKDGVAIAGTRSNEAQSSADTIETASPTSGEWRTFLAGRKDWSVNVGYLVMDDSVLGVPYGSGVRDLLKVGTSYTLKFKERNAADGDGVSGTAILTNCVISATIGSLVTGSFSFKGTGELS